MNERPTPESDNAKVWTDPDVNGVQVAYVPIAFARKLERERDEAREALATLQSAYDEDKPA